MPQKALAPESNHLRQQPHLLSQQKKPSPKAGAKYKLKIRWDSLLLKIKLSVALKTQRHTKS
jgi:hypothetical protein